MFVAEVPVSNCAKAEFHNHGSPLWPSMALCACGLLFLGISFTQGKLYTQEAQLTRERLAWQQEQIVELRSKVNMAEAKLFAAEGKIRRLENHE